SFTTHDTIIHPDELPLLDRAVRDGFEQGKPYDLIFKIIRPGGEIGWMQSIAEPDIDGDGNVVKIFGTAQDITERKQAEEELRESEERFKDIAESMSDWIWEVDNEGKYVYCSGDVERSVGYTNEEMIGRSLFSIIAPEEIERIGAFLNEIISTKKTFSNLEKWVVDCNGNRKCLSASGVPIFDNAGNLKGYRGVNSNITERKEAEEEKAKLEDQLRQSQKMESIGRLAGGVAHDFNNILTGINGYSEMIIDDLEPGDPMRADLEEIKSAGERAAGLTEQLLAFSRKQTISPKVVRPNEILERSQKMLRRIIGEDIDLKFIPAKNLGRIKADPAQLDQILVNLAVNAREAMPDGGKLTIETENVSLDEEFCTSHVEAQPGDYIMLAVSDNGQGMDEQTKSNIFEPFFSSKDSDTNTGLGLATVYGIVKQNGGFISVYSELDKG
ncbi:MAG: PAS domain S-box protein, partial [Proteobacteria bacterium]|nr:PAS domain S-box protein [Pseudomonadota bacterium]